MLRQVAASVAVLLYCCGLAGADKLSDRPGMKDPPQFTRMPHFYLSLASSFKETQYDFHEFSIEQGNKVIKQRVEGHKLIYFYTFDRSAGPQPSGLQVARNYQNAVAKIGGKVLYDGASRKDPYDKMTFLLTKDGKEIWAELFIEGGAAYYLTIVEREKMKQEVTANATALHDGLAQNGHVEVPGIFFDFNKADIKPESEASLQELAKLLQSNPTLKVWLVGHTDNVGSAETNAALSQARAAAVVKALTGRFNISAARLTAEGVGPFSPVASNASEEGRARNRRTELVAKP